MTKVLPPPEMGPPLEWCEESKKYPLERAIILVCFCLLSSTFIYRGFDWVYEWFPWTFTLALSVLYYLDKKKDRVLAGAQWVQERDKWVSTYELTRVRFTTVGYNRAAKLVDIHGNELVIVLRHTQMNPKLWDLVYNGIVYSVATGNCDISKAARRILKV